MTKRILVLACGLLLSLCATAQLSIQAGYLHQDVNVKTPAHSITTPTWGLYAEADYTFRLPHNLGFSAGVFAYATTYVPLKYFSYYGTGSYGQEVIGVPLRLSYVLRLSDDWQISPCLGIDLMYALSYKYSEDATPSTTNYLDPNVSEAVKAFTFMPVVGLCADWRHWRLQLEYSPLSPNRALHEGYSNSLSTFKCGVGYKF